MSRLSFVVFVALITYSLSTPVTFSEAFAQVVEKTFSSGSAYGSSSASTYQSAPTPTPTTAPAPTPTPTALKVHSVVSVLSFSISFPLTKAQWDSKKDNIVSDMAKKLGVKSNTITATAKGHLSLADEILVQTDRRTTTDTVLLEAGSNLAVNFKVTVKVTSESKAAALTEATAMENLIKTALTTVTDGSTKLGGVQVPNQTVEVKVARVYNGPPAKSDAKSRAAANAWVVLAVASSLYGIANA